MDWNECLLQCGNPSTWPILHSSVTKTVLEQHQSSPYYTLRAKRTASLQKATRRRVHSVGYSDNFTFTYSVNREAPRDDVFHEECRYESKPKRHNIVFLELANNVQHWPPWEAEVLQLIKKCPAFYGTWRLTARLQESHSGPYKSQFCPVQTTTLRLILISSFHLFLISQLVFHLRDSRLKFCMQLSCRSWVYYQCSLLFVCHRLAGRSCLHLHSATTQKTRRPKNECVIFPIVGELFRNQGAWLRERFQFASSGIL